MKITVRILAVLLALFTVCAAFGGCGKSKSKSKSKGGNDGTGSEVSDVSSGGETSSAGGTASNGGGTSSKGSGGTASNAGTTGEKQPTGVQKLVFWNGYGSGYTATFDELINRFNSSQKNYSIKSVNQGGTVELRTKLLSINKKNYPSVMNGTPITIAQYAENDFCQPIQPYLDADSDKWTNDIFPAVRASFIDDEGHMIGSPFGVSINGFAVNLKLLGDAKHNIGECTTFEKIADIAIDAKNAGVLKNKYGYVFNLAQEAHDMLRIQGVDFVDANNGWGGTAKKSLITTGETKAAFEKYFSIMAKMVKNKVTYPFSTAGSLTFISEFKNGNVLFMSCTNSYFENIIIKGKPAFDWTFIPAVGLDDNADFKGQCLPEGTGLFMCNTGNKREMQGAYEFIKFCAKKESQELWCTGTTYVPYTNAAASSSVMTNWQNTKYPQSKSIINALRNSTGKLTGTYAAVGNELLYGIQDALETVYSNPDKSPQDAMNKLNTRVQAALDVLARREELKKK